jgi:hypothetical protein
MPDLIACCTVPVDVSDPDVFVGYYLPPVYTVDGCDGSLDVAQAGRFETLAGVSQGTSLPAGWFPCGARPGVTTGGGGGGTGAVVAQISMVWQQGTFEDAGSGSTAWPDGGALSSLSAERWTVAPIVAPYTQWDFFGLIVVVHEVDTATDGGDIVVSLQDTSANNYATVTIADATPVDSPAPGQGIRAVATGAATATAATRLQFLIEDAPLGNDYWVEAYALGVLS